MSTPPTGSAPRTLTIAAVVLAVLTVGLIAGLVLLGTQSSSSGGGSKRAAGLRGDTLPPTLAGAPAPRFALADARGGRLTSASLAGRPYAVTFLYTDCPDVCPLIGDELREALAQLGPKARDTGVVAVSVDPRGDTPKAVRDWLRVHRAPANFHYLVGSAGQLTPVWNGYFAAPQTPGDPQSSHSAAIWLVDARGRLRAKYSAGVPVAPADVAHDLRTLIERG